MVTSVDARNPARRLAERVRALWPGLALCLALTALAVGLQDVEERTFGHPYVEALVVAILAGMALRTTWEPDEGFAPGIAFSAKQLLEIAVTLLGASVSLGALVASGPALLTGIVGTVVLSILASIALGRLLGLPVRMSILVACGNAICGNSAIAAVAPVIGADGRDVAASIAFTAVLGVLVVLGLPLFVPLAGLSEHQYGVMAGLCVYAVPQVLAATVPIGLAATQIGTVVKLVCVLLLGPVVLALSLIAPRLPPEGGATEARPGRPGIGKLVPWFIFGFLALASLRSLGLVPDAALGPLARIATVLTIVSMAALGLGVDVRGLAQVGGWVTLVVTGSLAVLIAVSLMLIRVLHLN